MKCEKCQAELPEESKFCLKCGEKVKSSFDKSYDNIERMIKEIDIIFTRWNAFLEKNPEIHKKYLKFVKSYGLKKKIKLS